MASWRLFLPFLLLISSRIFVGFSRDLDAFLHETDSIVGLQGVVPTCMQKILPCKPYIKLPENPPPVCCLPLKEMLGGDLVCLCSFFNNAELLKALNVTQSEALKLPKACGADDVDISVCHNAANRPPTPTGSTSPPPPAAKTSYGTNSPAQPNISTKNKNNVGYGFAAISSYVALLLSAL